MESVISVQAIVSGSLTPATMLECEGVDGSVAEKILMISEALLCQRVDSGVSRELERSSLGFDGNATRVAAVAIDQSHVVCLKVVIEDPFPFHFPATVSRVLDGIHHNEPFKLGKLDVSYRKFS